MPNKLLAALVALMLTACGSPMEEDVGTASVESELKAAPRPAPVVAWATQVTDSAGGTFKTSFAISTTRDLYAALDIPVALAGQHVAAYEFVSPDGVVFQRTTVAFSTGSAKTYRVWSSMPVAGTWIQQFQLSGGWKVQVFLDAEATPRATRAFTLQ